MNKPLLATLTSLLTSSLVAGLTLTAASAAPEPNARVTFSAKPGLSAPSSIEVGTKFAIRGKVKTLPGARKRVVIAKVGKRKVAKTRTNKRGKFTLRVRAASAPTTTTYTVTSRKVRGLKAYKRSVRVTVVAAPSTGVTSNWPSTAITVPLGSTIPVSGTVTGSQPAGRTVVVQQYLGNAWVDRASATSAADGSYATALPASWLFNAPARVVVKAAGRAPEAAAAQVTATVTPTWTPGGSASSWVPVYDGYPIRLNPCESVEYSANLSQAPAFAREALNDALASVSQASGITFVNVGDSTGIGRPEPGYSGIPANADLLISWVHDNQTTASQPPTNGGVAIHDVTTAGSDAYGATRVAKKSAVNMNADYHAGWTRTLMTHVYRHELGHIVGLGHPTAQDQVMGAGEAASTNFGWGAGDLAGFARFGLQAGCVTG